jgi:hypothetical protein
MIKGELIGGDKVILSVDKLSVNTIAAVKLFISKFTYVLMRRVMQDKLSGQVLNVRTGNLRRSIPRGTKVVESGDNIVGVVGLGDDKKVAKYGRLHEYGGTIPAHVVEVKNKKALMWMSNGSPRFAKRVNIPAVKMPERSFLRSTLKEAQGEFNAGINAAIQKAIKNES